MDLKKKKFYEKETPYQYTPGYWQMKEKKKNLIDNETALLTPSINSRDKNNIELKKNLKPDDFTLPYLNTNNNKNIDFYYNNKDLGAGRGFGNLNISNEIRNSNSSRYDNPNFREYIENKQFFDYRFNYLDKNFQNPNNLILPFPRGGDTTRRLNQCVKPQNIRDIGLNKKNVPSPIDFLDSSLEYINNIEFKY